MKLKLRSFNQDFPECLESVKITMGQQNIDCNQFSSWTSRWDHIVLITGIRPYARYHATSDRAYEDRACGFEGVAQENQVPQNEPRYWF